MSARFTCTCTYMYELNVRGLDIRQGWRDTSDSFSAPQVILDKLIAQLAITSGEAEVVFKYAQFRRKYE